MAICAAPSHESSIRQVLEYTKALRFPFYHRIRWVSLSPLDIHTWFLVFSICNGSFRFNSVCSSSYGSNSVLCPHVALLRCLDVPRVGGQMVSPAADPGFRKVPHGILRLCQACIPLCQHSSWINLELRLTSLRCPLSPFIRFILILVEYRLCANEVPGTQGHHGQRMSTLRSIRVEVDR